MLDWYKFICVGMLICLWHATYAAAEPHAMVQERQRPSAPLPFYWSAPVPEGTFNLTRPLSIAVPSNVEFSSRGDDSTQTTTPSDWSYSPVIEIVERMTNREAANNYRSFLRCRLARTRVGSLASEYGPNETAPASVRVRLLHTTSRLMTEGSVRCKRDVSLIFAENDQALVRVQCQQRFPGITGIFVGLDVQRRCGNEGAPQVTYHQVRQALAAGGIILAEER